MLVVLVVLVVLAVLEEEEGDVVGIKVAALRFLLVSSGGLTMAVGWTSLEFSFILVLRM